jgi:hypothetical protein
MTPGLCLDPENYTEKRQYKPGFLPTQTVSAAPMSHIMPRSPNRRLRRHCSVFP